MRIGILRSRRELERARRYLPPGERAEVESLVHAGARLTPGYLVLLFCSCGIASLGLLQSSAAVVIGAMLISPLMGPILSMGLALARVELKEFRSAVIALACGAVVSVLAAAIISWASPLNAVTPEILSRTRPTLLDLVVALLSGFVAAYVIFSRKVGVIAGVAIATALMRPLAVAGYGIATRSAAIAGGAGLLFLANVVAILVAVFLTARLYGFSPAHRRRERLHMALMTLAMVLLAAPLALSLRDIGVETRRAVQARAVIEAVFQDTSGRIETLAVSGRGVDAGVEAVVMTRAYVPEAAQEVQRRLGGVPVLLDQVVTASPNAAGSAGSSIVNLPTSAPPTEAARVRAFLDPVMPVAAIREETDRLVVTPGTPVLPLGRYREIETALSSMLGKPVYVVPPPIPLAPIPFAFGSSALEDEARRAIETNAWALEHWEVRNVLVTGHASIRTERGNEGDTALAEARAASVAEEMTALGYEVSTTTLLRPVDDGDAARSVIVSVSPLSRSRIASE